MVREGAKKGAITYVDDTGLEALLEVFIDVLVGDLGQHGHIVLANNLFGKGILPVSLLRLGGASLLLGRLSLFLIIKESEKG